MYPLHEMDKNNIVDTIEKAQKIRMDFNADMIIFKLANKIDFTEFEIDFLSILVKHNHGLSERYKNLLIEIINEGKE